MEDSQQRTEDQGTGSREQGAEQAAPHKHDWQYNFNTHIHECSKCKTPAPPNWNEVPF